MGYKFRLFPIFISLPSPSFCKSNVPSSLQSGKVQHRRIQIELRCLILSGSLRLLNFTFTYWRRDCSSANWWPKVMIKRAKWMAPDSAIYLHKNEIKQLNWNTQLAIKFFYDRIGKCLFYGRRRSHWAWMLNVYAFHLSQVMTETLKHARCKHFCCIRHGSGHKPAGK